MLVKQKYVRKHLYMMVVEQLVDDLVQQGYEIKTQYPITSTLRADLFAVRGDEKIVMELTYGHIPDDALQRLRLIVSNEGFELRVIDISKVELER